MSRARTSGCSSTPCTSCVPGTPPRTWRHATFWPRSARRRDSGKGNRTGVRAVSLDGDRKVTIAVKSKYGPWGIVAGGSDGGGAAFARGMASRGMNVVLVARRVPVLEASAADIRAQHGVKVRTVALDLSASGALSEL